MLKLIKNWLRSRISYKKTEMSEPDILYALGGKVDTPEIKAVVCVVESWAHNALLNSLDPDMPEGQMKFYLGAYEHLMECRDDIVDKAVRKILNN